MSKQLTAREIAHRVIMEYSEGSDSDIDAIVALIESYALQVADRERKGRETFTQAFHDSTDRESKLLLRIEKMNERVMPDQLLKELDLYMTSQGFAAQDAFSDFKDSYRRWKNK